jgi:hypothetical protein
MNIDFKKEYYESPVSKLHGYCTPRGYDVYVVFCTELPITMAHVWIP